MTKLLRFIIETIGSFFIATSILIARRNVYHKFQLAVLYGGLLYSLNFQSQNKATFNFSLTIVNTIAGKYSFGDLIVAFLAQILGTILGCVCGEFLHQGETSVIIAGGDTDITIYLTGAQFLMGFLFSFLLCIVSASASKELTTAYPVAIIATVVSASLTMEGWGPFTALNPIAECIFLEPKYPNVAILKIASLILGSIVAGLYSLFMSSNERRRDDYFIGLADLSRNQSPFSYKSWLVGVTLEGIGSFYLTLIFGLSGSLNSDAWPLAVGAAVTSLTFLSLGGYFNPAVVLAFYLSDRNCPNPSMSTFSMISYLLSQLIWAVIGSFCALWIGNGNIQVPMVNPLVSNFPNVFISEIVFSGLIIICHMYSSCQAARVWTQASTNSALDMKIHSCENQSLAVGLATSSALLAVTGLSRSPLNPFSAIALVASTYIFEMIFGFDQYRYGEINYDFQILWIFFVCPFISSILVAIAFSVSIRVSSSISQWTSPNESRQRQCFSPITSHRNMHHQHSGRSLSTAPFDDPKKGYNGLQFEEIKSGKI